MDKEGKFVFVFDLDNTLVETNFANNLAYHEAIKKVVGINVQMSKSRFTRSELFIKIPSLSPIQFDDIVSLKEKLYVNFLSKTTLNIQLFRILNLLKIKGLNTILLTESHKARAQQVCSFHHLSSLFCEQYYKEDYSGYDKYLLLSERFNSMNDVILFENEYAEIKKAILYKIPEIQIITIKF